MKRNFLLTALMILLIMILIGCSKDKSNESEQDNQVDEQLQSTEKIDDSEQYVCDTSDIDKNGYSIAPADLMEGDLKIPNIYMDNPVVEVGDYAFATYQITNLEIGDNILKIGESAFFDCSDLTSVKFNEKIKIIGDSAFLQAGLSGDMIIPDSVETIEANAFALTNLETVHVGKGVKFIGGGAFVIDNLERVTFDCKNVEFESDALIFSEDCEDLTIVAPKGSTAEQYAKENNIKFEER